MSILQAGWRAAGTALSPLAPWHLGRRAGRGKEDPARLAEKMGAGTLPRPAGRLVWLHAASVGETLTVLPLAPRLAALAADADGPATVLLTTGTPTSATLVAERAPAGVIHRYAPLDTPPFVERFLAHWRPDALVLADSEIWPTTLAALARRRIPVAVVNARMSARSFRGWRRLGRLARPVFAALDRVAAQSAGDAERFAALGAPWVMAAGNLKADAPPLPADADALAALESALAGRPVWLAASTHPGEEALAADVHLALAGARQGLLTIVVPRHPDRGPAIAAEIAGRAGVRVALRSRGEGPDAGVGVLVADTLGELGLFYRLAPVVVLGGSFVPVGGHNPFEPARLGAAIVTGPETETFRDAFRALAERKAVCVVAADALAATVDRLLDRLDERAAMAEAARAFAAESEGATDRVAAILAPLLAAPDAPASADGAARAGPPR